jgi:hypothetical protein
MVAGYTSHGNEGGKNNILFWNVVVPILPKLTCNPSSRVHIHAKLPTEFAATRVDFLPAVRCLQNVLPNSLGPSSTTGTNKFGERLVVDQLKRGNI